MEQIKVWLNKLADTDEFWILFWWIFIITCFAVRCYRG